MNKKISIKRCGLIVDFKLWIFVVEFCESVFKILSLEKGKTFVWKFDEDFWLWGALTSQFLTRGIGWSVFGDKKNPLVKKTMDLW